MASSLIKILILAWTLGLLHFAASQGTPVGTRVVKATSTITGLKTVYIYSTSTEDGKPRTKDTGKPQQNPKPTKDPTKKPQKPGKPEKPGKPTATTKPRPGKGATESAKTLTEIPTGAELVTLKGDTRTKPGFITTTKEGSSDPTILPVIIPFTGPPVVCFGCFPSFPPGNLKISTPKFCIKVFGAKIGSCPPDKGGDDNNHSDNDDGGGGKNKDSDDKGKTNDDDDKGTDKDKDKDKDKGKDKNDKDKDKDKDDDEEEDKPTSTREESSSTTSSSTSAFPDLPTHICSLEACGAKCVNPPKRSLRKSTLSLSKRVNPSEREWPDPENEDRTGDFVRDEVKKASSGDLGNGKFVHLSTDSEYTTSNFLLFEDKVASLSAAGLYGCTSIFVISRRGAWGSHIWERVYGEKNEGNFQKSSIWDVGKGRGNEFHKYGIKELRNQENVGPRGVMFGSTDDNPDIRIVIVTPRPRVAAAKRWPDGKIAWARDDIRNDWTSNSDMPPIYQGYINRVKAYLKASLGENVPIKTVSYTPLIETLDMSKRYLDAERKKDVEQIAEIKREINRHRSDKEFDQARGKVHLQYRPASDCHPKAKFRLWVELGVSMEYEWDPSPTQSIKSQATETGAVGKRQACPIKPTKRKDKTTSKETSKPTKTKDKKPTSRPNPPGGIKCEKDADCQGPNMNCNSGKKSVCTKDKKCQCKIICQKVDPPPKMTTKKKPEPTKTPVDIGPVSCNAKNILPGHSEIADTSVWKVAEKICSEDRMLGPGELWEKNYDRMPWENDLHFSVEWDDMNCKAQQDKLNVKNPFDERSKYDGSRCVEVFLSLYQDCNNGGVGGSRHAGCLRYHMEPVDL